MRRLDGRALAALGTGHAYVDLCQGAVPALLPFLALARGWSYTALASLMLAASIGSSVIQPLFGLAADRSGRAWLPMAGVLVAGGGIAAVGLSPRYWLTVAAIAVSGVGIAAFHPDGARLAGLAGRDEPSRGMSIFSLGGNAGFALGPILVTPLVLAFGLPGTTALLAPAVLVALVLRAGMPRGTRLQARRNRESGSPRAAPARDDVRSFVLLSAVIGLRSCMFFGLQAFIPAYFVVSLHRSASLGNAALTAMLVAGAIGTLAGGVLADRHGARAVLRCSLLVALPLLIALPFAGAVIAVALLVGIGLTVISSFSTTVVLGQALLPSRPGLASGVTLGLAIGAGGAGAALLGLLADAAGPGTVLWAIAALPVPAVILTARLPEPPATRGRSATSPDRARIPARATVRV